jgi:hypothetical protein
MEVASPLTTLGPSPNGAGGGGGVRGNKRTCSPLQQQTHIDMIDGGGGDDPNNSSNPRMLMMNKRRRFHAPTEMDSLSADFSSHSIFFNNTNHANHHTNGNNNNHLNHLTPSQQQQQQKSHFATNGGKSLLALLSYEM